MLLEQLGEESPMCPGGGLTNRSAIDILVRPGIPKCGAASALVLYPASPYKQLSMHFQYTGLWAKIPPISGGVLLFLYVP